MSAARLQQLQHQLHPRLRPIGGLELASGIPVVPISPEEAVAELRRALA